MSSFKERSESRRQRPLSFLVEEESCQELMSIETPDRSDETIQDSCRDGASLGITDENRVETSKDSIGKESNESLSDYESDSKDEYSSCIGDLQCSLEEGAVVLDRRNSADVKVSQN
ncbi:hypothetical protein AVEN_251023-1 [Araneus ventricosus]|uniref:Uncharacterized protein n=1 Tax=Araneus ventricosus TaxID=182803 RepID=A0A4Y2Q220_ARAVE|nr:hypothetical protein AVEN_251023-1 [Araneus ventricosus]